MSGSTRRVAVGGFAHESNSFTGMPTTMEDFLGPSGEVVRGNELLAAHRGVNTVVAGLIDGAQEHGYEVLPTIYAATCPGGAVARDAYEQIRDELVDGIAALMPLDGVLLALHGAMVAEDYPDPEGDILTRLRARIGAVPISVVLDMHGNNTATTFENADIIVGYKSYPHVDLAESGLKAAHLLARLLDGEVRVTKSFIWLPILLPSMNMRTQQGPMADVQRLGAELCQASSACLDISIFGGFPYSDAPSTGGSVLVYTNDDQALADQLARQVATELWQRKTDFWIPMASPEQAVQRALAASDGPVVLVDASDNPGSGGVGDTTLLLHLLIEHGATDTVVAALYDPETVAKAIEVGVGNLGQFAIGGKVNPNHGRPVETEAYVKLISDGRYLKTGPMGHGQQSTIGRSAVLQLDGIDVVVCEGRTSVNDPEILRSLGIEPSRKRILAMKVKGHFRAAFGDIIKEAIDVDAPGAAAFNVKLFEHECVTRPIYPYDEDVVPAFLQDGSDS